MEGEFRPAHKLLLSKAKGKYVATCVCGWTQTGKSETEEESFAKYQRHTGTFEKRLRR